MGLQRPHLRSNKLTHLLTGLGDPHDVIKYMLANDRFGKIYFVFQLFRDEICTSFDEISPAPRLRPNEAAHYKYDWGK